MEVLRRAIAKTALLALVVATPTGCGGTKGKQAAERAVVEFHQRLDRGDFGTIYGEAHPDFKKATSEKDFVTVLDAVHRKLGPILSTGQAGWKVGTFNLQVSVSLTYKTAFTHGVAVESFTYRVTDSTAQLLGYNINSNALITK